MATTFRSRPKKANPVVVKETLHSRHSEMVKQFKAVKKSLAGKRKTLKELLKEIEILEEDDEPEAFTKRESLTLKCKALQEEITRIEANTDEDEYYAQNSDLIFQYFQDKASSTSPECACATPAMTITEMPGNVIQFLQEPEDRNQNQNQSDLCQPSEPKKRGQQGVHDYFQLKENVNGRKKILDRYMSNIDPSYVVAIERITDDTCPECRGSLSTNTNEGISECTNCGFSQLVKVDSDKRSYKETTNTEMSYITYKRINHFDWKPKPLEWNSELRVCYSLVAAAA